MIICVFSFNKICVYFYKMLIALLRYILLRDTIIYLNHYIVYREAIHLIFKMYYHLRSTSLRVAPEAMHIN